MLDSCLAFRHSFLQVSKGVCKHYKIEQGNALLTMLGESLVIEAGIGSLG